MTLEVKCKSCKEYFTIKKDVNDRGELNYLIGKNTSFTCSYCHSKRIYISNDFRAVRNRLIYFILLALTIIFTIMIFYSIQEFYQEHERSIEDRNSYAFTFKLYGLLLIPYAIFQIFIKNQNKNIIRFNSFTTK
jgi:hypothetical protein